MGEPQVFWDGGPAPPVSEQLPPQVFVIRAGTREFVRLLAEPQRVWTHWVYNPDLRPKGRTRPCTRKGCVHCKAGLEQKLRAYAAALRWVRDPMAHVRQGGRGGTWDKVVFDLCEDAWYALAAQVLGKVPAGGEPQWRGVVLDVTRPGLKHNGKVVVQVLERQLTDPIPEAFDVRPILQRIWGVRQRVIPDNRPTPADADGPPIIPFRQKGGA